MFRKAALCAILTTTILAVGCESAPKSSAGKEPVNDPPKAIADAAPDLVSSDAGAPAQATAPPAASKLEFPIKTYERPPLGEEYHDVSVVWNGTGQTDRELFDRFDRPTPKSSFELTKKGIEQSSEMFVRILTPRAFKAKAPMEVGVETSEGEVKVALEKGDAIYVYEYLGEGMCDVAYLDKSSNKLALGTSTCPYNFDDEQPWETAPGNTQLAEGIEWWFKVKNDQGQDGWVMLENAEVDVKLEPRDEIK